MYRDGSTHLDEHDRAVGAIQIADGLIGGCLEASKHLTSAEHRWRAVREIQDDYSELWYQLDTARRLLAQRGANTIGYDELRKEVAPVLPMRGEHLDTKPVEDARRAIEELRLAMPGTDWRAIEARTRGLAGTSLMKHGQRIAVAAIAIVFLLGVGTYAASTTPEQQLDPKVAQRMEMKRDLADIADQRKDRIDSLALMIGGRCNRPLVHEYMKLLVMDGQWTDAHVYGEDFKARCGDDAEVRKWARMAKKKSDRLLGL